MFDQVREKALREILRIFHGVPAAAHETVKRRPIGLAKFRERGLRNFRFGLSSCRREHRAPVGRRKQIALIMPVPCGGVHVSSLYQDRTRKASREKNWWCPNLIAFISETLAEGCRIILCWRRRFAAAVAAEPERSQNARCSLTPEATRVDIRHLSQPEFRAPQE